MMNFLETLAAEWYIHKGYFVRTNVKFGRRPRGGWIGEMDVVAYHPQTYEFIHIETSTDSDSWSTRRTRFQKKFRDARKYYMEVFPFKNTSPRQIAMVGFNRVINEEHSLGEGIEIVHIPDFINQISSELSIQDPQRNAVSETSPLLRAIQYSSFYRRADEDL